VTIDTEILRQMIAEDDLGLLTLPVKSEGMTKDQRLVANFAEITEFVRMHGREPAKAAADVAEMKLYFRLDAILGNEQQREALTPHDELGILREPEPPASLEEALAADPLGLLDGPAPEIDLHALRNVPKPSATPDKVAQRERCEDFELYEPLFKACHEELRAGVRKIVPFSKEGEIKAGTFYLLKGLLAYVAAEGERRKEHGRINTRLRCIFENGTEADLLLRSFSSQLYRFGKQVTDPEAKTMQVVEDQLGGGATGFVYVLRSLSEDPEIVAIPDLHKIGFTTNSTATRTSGAARSATFLGGPVKEVATFEMPAAMAGGVEGLLHRFFSAVRLDAWFERDGVTTAEIREWFSVPVDAVVEAIDLIEAESIQNYEYDRETKTAKLRS
jgi:T5orf172 domain